MSTTQADLDGILRRILETPEDDAPRLIYSDALEEMGQTERAEFIRLQILDSSEHFAERPFMRARELINEFGKQWFPPIGGVKGFEVYRGFAGEVVLTCYQFMKHAKELFSQHPITSVTLTDKQPSVTTFNGIGSGIYAWFAGDDLVGSSSLPVEIYKQFDSPKSNLIGKQCFGLDGATADLSRACVNYGRSIVNLPPLP